MKKKYIAFTLSEVLITLGIIGVVAAITMPTLINKHRSHALKVSFLKTYSTLANAAELAKNDLSLYSIQENFSNEFEEAFAKRLKIVDVKVETRKYKNGIRNYSNTNGFNTCLRGQYVKEYIFNNGASYCIREGGYMGELGSLGYVIGFDTNGPYKGPNRAGYDVFEVRFTNDSLEPYYDSNYKSLNYCTKTNNPDASGDWYGTGGGYSHQSNGRFCAHYALTDVNPDNRAKGYWESLY